MLKFLTLSCGVSTRLSCQITEWILAGAFCCYFVIKKLQNEILDLVCISETIVCRAFRLTVLRMSLDFFVPFVRFLPCTDLVSFGLQERGKSDTETNLRLQSSEVVFRRILTSLVFLTPEHALRLGYVCQLVVKTWNNISKEEGPEERPLQPKHPMNQGRKRAEASLLIPSQVCGSVMRDLKVFAPSTAYSHARVLPALHSFFRTKACRKQLGERFSAIHVFSVPGLGSRAPPDSH